MTPAAASPATASVATRARLLKPLKCSFICSPYL
jgi:hypothetical protein